MIDKSIDKRGWNYYPDPIFIFTIEVLGMGTKFHPILYKGCNYFFMLEIKLIRV